MNSASRRAEAWILAWLALASLAVYGPLLRPGQMPFSVHSDAVAYYLGVKWALYHSIRQGAGIPFWQWDQFGGMPALTNPQSLFTYPLHFLYYFLSPAQATGPTMYLHFLLSGVGYALLGRSMGVSPAARATMGTAGLFSFKLLLLAYAGVMPLIPIVVLLPYLLAAALWLARSPGPRPALALALAGALILHGGAPQLVFYLSLFLGPYLLGVVVCRIVRRRDAALLCWLGLSGALALGMCAYLLWPIAADLPIVTRGHVAALSEVVSEVGPRHLLLLLSPEALGTPVEPGSGIVELWELEAYFGVLPFLLALCGLARTIGGGRRWPGGLFAVAFVLSMLFAMDTPLLRLLAHLPGFRLFRVPGRFFFLTTLFGIGLCGLGYDALVEWLPKIGLRPSWARLLLAPLLLGGALEGLAYARTYLHMLPIERVVPRTAYGDRLSQDRALFRVAPLSRSTLNYGWAAPFGLQVVTGYDPYNLYYYRQYLQVLETGKLGAVVTLNWGDLHKIARPDLLDALNGKYILTREPLPGADPRFELIGTYPEQPMFRFYRNMTPATVLLYRNRSALPRLWFPEQVVEVADATAMERAVLSEDLHKTAVVLGGGDSRLSPTGATGEPRILSARPGELRVSLSTQEARPLLLSEIWHPGWRALLDGRPIPIQRADLTLMAVSVPAGSHELQLSFRPQHWRAAFWLSLCSAFLCLLLGLYALRRPVATAA